MAIYYLERAIEESGDEFLARKILAFAYYNKDDIDSSLFNTRAGLSQKEDPELKAFYNRLLKEKNAQEHYIRESTLHFNVLFDGYEHSELSRKVIDILEDAYNSIGNEMNYFPSQPVTVILYTEKDFYDVTRVPVWAGGAYDGKIRLAVKGIERQGDRALRSILFHEYTHAMVYSITPECPIWINEGLAEYFSEENIEKTGQVIPLTSLEKSFPTNKQQAKTAYRESYSAVSYLIDRFGAYSIKEFLFSLAEGTDLDEAFASAFFITYNEFVSEWGKN
jgi:hypothetical protein